MTTPPFRNGTVYKSRICGDRHPGAATFPSPPLIRSDAFAEENDWPAFGCRQALRRQVTEVEKPLLIGLGTDTTPVSELNPGASARSPCAVPSPGKPATPFRCFYSSPEAIRLVVMMHVRFPLGLRSRSGITHHPDTGREWGGQRAGMCNSDAAATLIAAR